MTFTLNKLLFMALRLLRLSTFATMRILNLKVDKKSSRSIYGQLIPHFFPLWEIVFLFIDTVQQL